MPFRLAYVSANFPSHCSVHSSPVQKEFAAFHVSIRPLSRNWLPFCPHTETYDSSPLLLPYYVRPLRNGSDTLHHLEPCRVSKGIRVKRIPSPREGATVLFFWITIQGFNYFLSSLLFIFLPRFFFHSLSLCIY